MKGEKITVGEESVCSVISNIDTSSPPSTDVEYTINIRKGRKVAKKKNNQKEECHETYGDFYSSIFPDEVQSTDHSGLAPAVNYHESIEDIVQGDRGKKLMEQGSTLCVSPQCTLHKVLDSEDVEVWRRLVSAGKSASCKCNGSCTLACRRYAAYTEYSKCMKYSSRKPLPICTRIFIENCFGEGTTGYKDDNVRK